MYAESTDAGMYPEASSPLFPAAPTTVIPSPTALSISVSSILFIESFLVDIERLMIPTFCFIAYSIAAITSEILPWPLSPSALIDKIFASLF